MPVQNTLRVLEIITETGPVVIIPGILFLFGLIATRNILKNLRNTVLVLLGMSLTAVLLTLFINFFQPIANTIVINSNKKFEVIDAGWLLSEKVFTASPVIFQIIIAVLILNLVMLLLRFTRTINIDLWNWWNFLLIGSVVFYVTEIKWIAIFIALISAAVTLVLADIYAPYVKNYIGLANISTPQANIICWAPFAHLVNSFFNKIPFIRRVHIFCEEIQYKMGFLSEPLIIGFLLGFVISIITRFKTIFLNPWNDLSFAFVNGLQLSIIIFLFPRAVNIMLKGLVPALSDIESFVQRRITKRRFYLGIDPIFLVNQPSVICLSAVMVPITIYLATLLPGNKVLPGADLILIPFILVWAIIPSKGDLLRGFITAIIIIPLVLWVTTDMGAVFTNFYTDNNLELIEGYSQISSIGASSNIFFWIILQIVRPIFRLF